MNTNHHPNSNSFSARLRPVNSGSFCPSIDGFGGVYAAPHLEKKLARQPGVEDVSFTPK